MQGSERYIVINQIKKSLFYYKYFKIFYLMMNNNGNIIHYI